MTIILNDFALDPTVTNPFAQSVFDNADNSLVALYMPGSFYNRYVAEGVETKDYSPSDFHLTKHGAVTVHSTYATNAGPSYDGSGNPANYYDTGITPRSMMDDGGNRSIGWIAFSGLPTNGQTWAINGITITFVTSGATGNQINIAGTAAAQAAAVATFVNANTATLGVSAYVIGSATTCFLYGNTLGSAGNVTLTEGASNTTVSGATLVNGNTAGITLMAVGRTTASGKFSPIGSWLAAANYVALNMWATNPTFNEGVSAYHYTNLPNARAYVAGESGKEGTDFIFGAGAFADGEVWAFRQRASGTLGVARNTTNTPAALPTLPGTLILTSGRGATPASLAANGGDLAMVWVRNRFLTPTEVAADYAAAKAFLAALDSPISI